MILKQLKSKLLLFRPQEYDFLSMKGKDAYKFLQNTTTKDQDKLL